MTRAAAAALIGLALIALGTAAQAVLAAKNKEAGLRDPVVLAWGAVTVGAWLAFFGALFSV